MNCSLFRHENPTFKLVYTKGFLKFFCLKIKTCKNFSPFLSQIKLGRCFTLMGSWLKTYFKLQTPNPQGQGGLKMGYRGLHRPNGAFLGKPNKTKL